MKKTCTITLHCTDNAGSTLQAYALQQFLLKNGVYNEILDYRPKYLISYGNPLKRFLKNILYWKTMRSQKQKNVAFEKKYLKETQKTFKYQKELFEHEFPFDCFITGSDQIWNPSYPCGRDSAYYLNFVKGAKKIAYAASIGKSFVPSKEREMISNYVRDIDCISVREESSKLLLEQCGIDNVEYVCDPTLLLSKDDYSKIETIRIKEKYIVVYLVKPSPLLDALVEKIKQKYKCKVVLIYGVADNCDCDIHIRDTSPDEFLGFINHAEFVIASSFHAVMFSHIFEKNFAIVLPQHNQARIEQFLKITGLDNRIVRSIEEVNNLEIEIDYANVKSKLETFKKHSISFILGAVNEQ